MTRIFFCLLICCALVVAPVWAEQPGAFAELETVSLQLKWKHQFQFAGYYAAVEKGYYRDVGLNVELQERTPGPERPGDTVLDGRATYGIEGTQLLINRMQGKPLVALSAIFQHSPTVVMALQESQIKTAKGMAGKRVMSFGGTDIELYAMLLQEGVPVESIAWQPMSFDINSLISGEADLYSGYLTNEPFFLSQQQIPISIINPINYGVDFYAEILFTSEKEIAEHPQRVRAFRDASLRGWQYAVEHPEEIVDLILQKYRQDKSREHLLFEAQETIKLVKSEVVAIGHVNPGRFRHMADILKQLGRIESTIDLAGFVYDETRVEPLSAKERTWLRQNHRVQVFVAHAPPLVYVDGDRIEGLAIDYLNRLASDYGVRIEYVTSSWEEAVTGIQNKTGPDVIPLISPDPARRAQMALSEPFLTMPFVIFSLKDSGFIGRIEDLVGLTLAIPRGFLLESILAKDYPGINTILTDTMQEAVELLATGEVDAYIGSLLMTSHIIKEMGWENIKVAAPVPFVPSEHVLAARNDWPELVLLFNRILRQLTPQEHAEIRQRWLSMRYEYGVTQGDVWKWGGLAAGLFLLGFILFSFWNRRLQNEITNRKTTEVKLVNSVLQYQHLVQTLPHGIIEIDQDGLITYCNTPFSAMLGYHPRELFGRKLTTLMSSEDLRQVQPILRPMDNELGHQRLTLQLLDRQLKPHAVQFDCDYSQFSEGADQIVIVTDLSRQEQVEKALLESEEIYRHTFENIQAGVAYLTIDGSFTRVNKYLCRMLGYSATELLQLDFQQITHPEDQQVGQQQVHRLLAHKMETFSLSKRYLKKDGSIVWGLVSVVLLSHQGEADRIVAVIQDIDDIKRQQEEVAEKALNLESIIGQRTAELQNRVTEVEELNQAMLNLTEDLQGSYRQLEQKGEEVREVNRELESFAYSVSHDLRAPLRHVQGFAEILLESSKDELAEVNRRHLATIMGSADRMGKLIDDLLAFSRAGRSELQLRPVDTALIVKEVVSALKDVTVGRDILWQISALPVVTGDLATLRQVFFNLLDNAVKYSAPRQKTEIQVTCELAAEEVVFCVSDNGVGFDPEYAHKLFGVFSRLHRSDQFEGTGIGLANVKRIVKRHGGRVWAESEFEAGAKFYFSLPNQKDI